MLAFDPERKTAILVQQFRAPPFFWSGQEHMLEAIAGIQEDADPITTARREALEEAGLFARVRRHRLDHARHFTERMTLYLAAYRHADRITEGGGVATEHENITVVEIELGRLAELMDAGELMDMKTRAGASPENAIPGTVLQSPIRTWGLVRRRAKFSI